MPPASAHTSEVIAELTGEVDERLTVRDIIAVLGDRTYALLIVVLGIPNCLPMPPPLPLLCGFLLAFVALQLVLGRATPWFPRILLDRPLNRGDVARVSQRAVPLFEKLEKYTRPRLIVFVEPIAHRVIGILVLVLAIALIFSPPFFGQIPLGFAICLIGFGLVERDGLIVFAGVLIGGLGASLSVGFAWAVIVWAVSFFH